MARRRCSYGVISEAEKSKGISSAFSAVNAKVLCVHSSDTMFGIDSRSGRVTACPERSRMVRAALNCE